MKVRKKDIAKGIYLAITTVALSTTFCPISVEGAEKEKKYEDTKGYVKVSSYRSRLNVREQANTKSKVLSKLCAGDVVNIIDETEDFYKIEFCRDSEVEYGYVYKDYIIIPEISDDKELMSAAVITSAKSAENRNYNMALACEKINGLILEPGEEFDWYGDNGVGQASKENGFKRANIILGGEYVLGYGGGVCQVSTALYNAVYDLEIEPDEIHHHSLRSSYVEKDMDATVSYGSKNFVFTNSKDYSIEIEAFTDGGQVTILLYKVED